MTLLMQNLNYVVSFVCFLFALHMFRNKSVYRVQIILLGGCFVVTAIQAFLLGFALILGRDSIAAALQPSMPLVFGPLSYLLFLSARQQNFRFKLQYLLHLLPAVFVTAEMILHVYIISVDFIVLTSIFAYTVALAFMIIKGEEQFIWFGDNKRSVYVWLIIFASYSLASFISDFFIFFEIYGENNASQSVSLLLTIIFKLLLVGFVVSAALQKSPYFDWVYQLSIQKKAQALSDNDAKLYERTIANFEQVISVKSVYLEENVSLKEMAHRVGVPVRILSKAINYKYGESYSRHMNRKRIAYAKLLLRNHPDMAMIDIMYDSGFRTKSSFNKEFKAIEAISPTEYRLKD